MIKYISFSIIALFLLVAWETPHDTQASDIDQMSVIEALERLGISYDDKKPKYNIEGVSAEVGESIVKLGFAPKPNGGTTGQQSKHFVCTSCHNTVQENPDLANWDPQARLEYSELRGIPYLQGTTLYGAVNRESYYNGDYEKKYGELVEPARNDIREAIHLCAVECAQGRSLDDWELESILAYLWTIDLQMSDLNISDSEKENISNAIDGNVSQKAAIEIINSKYQKDSPAHFILPPDNRKEGSGLTGNPDNGKLIYDNSCLHCHYNGKYSFLHLDDHKLSFKHLKRNMGKYTRHSIYQVIRWGVPTKSGKSSYMPQYTEEKMSNQQLADLRAYIIQRADS